jgi:hypothetical protein
MALSVTDVLDNPQAPSITAFDYKPDQLIAGDLKNVTWAPITLISGQNLLRGAVLGQITASGKYTLSASAAVDGSQTPNAILADDCNASTGDANCGAYVMGEFNTNALTFGTGQTIANTTVAMRDAGIFYKPTVSAADPS